MTFATFFQAHPEDSTIPWDENCNKCDTPLKGCQVVYHRSSLNGKNHAFHAACIRKIAVEFLSTDLQCPTCHIPFDRYQVLGRFVWIKDIANLFRQRPELIFVAGAVLLEPVFELTDMGTTIPKIAALAASWILIKEFDDHELL